MTPEETVLGFLVGVVLGIVFGVALGRNRLLAEVFGPYIKAANSIPRVVLGSIFVIWLGLGLPSKVALSIRRSHERPKVSTNQSAHRYRVACRRMRRRRCVRFGSGRCTLESVDRLNLYFAVANGLKVEDVHPIAVGAGNTFIAAMQKGQIDAGMTTEPTISRLLKSGDGKVLIDMRTAGTKAALGGTYLAASLYMQTAWVNSHKDAVQKLANAFVKTLKWIHAHTAEDIVARMPQDFYAGDKNLYLSAMKGSLDMFSPDGTMPPDGPQTVPKVLSAFDKNVQGEQVILSKTYTNEFVSGRSSTGSAAAAAAHAGVATGLVARAAASLSVLPHRQAVARRWGLRPNAGLPAKLQL